MALLSGFLTTTNIEGCTDTVYNYFTTDVVSGGHEEV